MFENSPDLLDPRLRSSCFFLGAWPLSTILLKNSQLVPWCILVPRRPDISEINQLNPQDRHQLMDEIAALSDIMQTLFNPDKLNVGSLGNIVSQMHVHVVARFTHDALWPFGIWQDHGIKEESYPNPELLIKQFRTEIQSRF